MVVTAAEMMGFGTSAKGIGAFKSSPSLLGDLGTSYVGSWVGNVITAGTTVSAFGCCLACTVGGARLVYAMSRDTFGDRGAGRSVRTPQRRNRLEPHGRKLNDLHHRGQQFGPEHRDRSLGDRHD